MAVHSPVQNPYPTVFSLSIGVGEREGEVQSAPFPADDAKDAILQQIRADVILTRWGKTRLRIIICGAVTRRCSLTLFAVKRHGYHIAGIGMLSGLMAAGTWN